jgi:hypothetical protein
MSIGPNIIDRTGAQPCIPNFYAVAKAMAEGRAPTLMQRVVKVVANLRKRVAR